MALAEKLEKPPRELRLFWTFLKLLLGLVPAVKETESQNKLQIGIFKILPI